MDAIGTYKLKNGNRLEIYHDYSPENPRSMFDNLTKMIFFGGKKFLGDEHDIILNNSYESREDFIERGGEYVKKQLDAVICLPVHYYEHSGASISLSNDYPYNCRWDSGTIGFVIVTKEDIKKEYGVKRISQKIIDKVMKVVEGEVEILSQYISGEIYGFQVINQNNEVQNSCWGFYGSDIKTNGILDHIDSEIIEETCTSI